MTNSLTEFRASLDDRKIDLVSAALVECQGKLKAAEMDAVNPFFKSRYATLGSVIESSREALYTAGLCLQQTLSLCDGVVSVHTLIRHKSGQFIDGGTMSLPIGENERNSDAQLAGSIATYLRRYAWSSVLGIYADSDDDGNYAPKGAIPRQNAPGRSEPVQHTTQAPKIAPSGLSAKPSATPEPKATAAFRLKALNNLNGAPGQPNRGLVEAFLRSKLWITGDQTPENWPLEHVPPTQADMVKLQEDVIRFEVLQREQNQTIP